MPATKGVKKRKHAVHSHRGMQKDFRNPGHHNKNENKNVIAFQAAADRFQFADFETRQNQVFANQLFPFPLQHVTVLHHHWHEKMRLEHTYACPKSVVEPIAPGLDPEHDPDNGQIEKKDDVRHFAIRKRDRNNGGAAGDSPVRGDVQSLSPNHDAAQFSAVKVRHSVDVTGVVDAALKRDGRFVIWTLDDIFSCHSCSLNWITAFPSRIQ